MDQDETWHAGRSRPRTHFVRWGQAQRPIFRPISVPIGCMNQDATWLMGTPLSLPKKGPEPTSQVFGPCLLWPNGWMDQDGPCYGGRPQPRDFVLDGDPRPLPKRRRSPPIFGPCLLRPNGWMDQDATWYGGRPRPKRHCYMGIMGTPLAPLKIGV